MTKLSDQYLSVRKDTLFLFLMGIGILLLSLNAINESDQVYDVAIIIGLVFSAYNLGAAVVLNTVKPK